MEKNYVINSKVEVPRTQSSAKRLKLLKFVMISSVVLIVFSFITSDFNYQVLKLLLLSLAFYVYYRNQAADQGGIVSTTVEAAIKSNELILDYLKIDRRDGMGERKEVITFPYQKIYGLEYCQELLSLRISGKPIIQVQSENQKKYPGNKIIVNGDDTRIHILYLDTANAKEFIDNLSELSGLKIEYKERF